MNLDADRFLCFWEQHFSDCPPISYVLRDDLAHRWFRFHSLPESKRYADNETEFIQLLARQNTVLLDAIGTGECYLVSGHYSSSPPLEEECSALSEFEFQEFLQVELDETPIHLELSFATHQLEYGSLDGVLRCVADCNISGFFVVNFDRQRIFAPYDGGVDVILKDTKERGEFKAKYSQWLSAHSEGL